MVTRRTMNFGSSSVPFSLTDGHDLEQSLLYSEELSIDLSGRRDAEYFRWFLASLLFGARISETIAKNTYRAFLRHGIDTPRKILRAGWNFLVCSIMREGGYVRYDGRKSDQVLRDCQMLIEDYGGKLSRLEAAASDSTDLEARIGAFYGVGPRDGEHFFYVNCARSGARRIPIRFPSSGQRPSGSTSISGATTGRA